MTEMKIEKGVAMPPRGGARARVWISVGRQMDIGDSFALPTGLKYPHSVASALNARLGDRRFTARTMPDGSCRVWRIK